MINITQYFGWLTSQFMLYIFLRVMLYSFALTALLIGIAMILDTVKHKSYYSISERIASIAAGSLSVIVGLTTLGFLIGVLV